MAVVSESSIYVVKAAARGNIARHVSPPLKTNRARRVASIIARNPNVFLGSEAWPEMKSTYFAGHP